MGRSTKSEVLSAPVTERRLAGSSKTEITRLLLIEDDADVARLLCSMLGEHAPQDIAVTHVRRIGAAEIYLAKNSVNIILLDIDLPDANGLECVLRARAAAPRAGLVLLTDENDESLTARALQHGAQDYLIKGQIDTSGLLRSLRLATARRTLEEAFVAEKEGAHVTLNSIADSVVCMNVAGYITFLNPAAEAVTGWSLREAAGRPMSDVLQILDASTRRAVPDPMARAIRKDSTTYLPSNSILVCRDRSEVAIEDSVGPIHDRGGNVMGAVIVFRDVSAARKRQAENAHLSEHDSLTGLPNRTLLDDRIGRAIAAAPRHLKSVAVLFMDLDGFKDINDSLGHLTGDKLLQSVSKRLVGCVRGSDTVSRHGGDEFVVVLSEVTNPQDVSILAGRLLQATAEPHCIDGHDLHVTASIGVSVYPGDGMDAETLIKNADTAMYKAKKGGRHGYRFFKPAMNVRASEQQSIRDDLGHALERDEFTLHYQPKIDLRTGQISGAEALLRWTHPVRGCVSPRQFIPVAEACGLIVPIGNWVLREACRQARSWLDAGVPLLSMAVNISAIEFRGEKLPERLFALLEDTGVDPKFLELELKENALMQDAESTVSILKQLKAGGVRLAIDDFGTGYSNLGYLRKFPIEALKVDHSFVSQIAASPDKSSIAAALINMGRSLGLRVVAEGVETDEELTFLKEYHCDEAQGYHFSPPVFPAQFPQLFDRISQANASKPQRSSAAMPN